MHVGADSLDIRQVYLERGRGGLIISAAAHITGLWRTHTCQVEVFSGRPTLGFLCKLPLRAATSPGYLTAATDAPFSGQCLIRRMNLSKLLETATCGLTMEIVAGSREIGSGGSRWIPEDLLR